MTPAPQITHRQIAKAMKVGSLKIRRMGALLETLDHEEGERLKTAFPRDFAEYEQLAIEQKRKKKHD